MRVRIWGSMVAEDHHCPCGRMPFTKAFTVKSSTREVLPFGIPYDVPEECDLVVAASAADVRKAFGWEDGTPEHAVLSVNERRSTLVRAYGKCGSVAEALGGVVAKKNESDMVSVPGFQRACLECTNRTTALSRTHPCLLVGFGSSGEVKDRPMITRRGGEAVCDGCNRRSEVVSEAV